MDMKEIRKQMEEIQLPVVDIKSDVLQQIKRRQIKRKRRIKIFSAIAAIVAITCLTQFERVAVVAENMYRNINVTLNDTTLIIDNEFQAVPIEIKDLNWVGSKWRGRYGGKDYPTIQDAENELKINLLKSEMGFIESPYPWGIPFAYFEKDGLAMLTFGDYIIGDLMNYTVIASEEGDSVDTSYDTEGTIYKGTVSMRVMFFTESGKDYALQNMEEYNYEEEYISKNNGIRAYIFKNGTQYASDEEGMLNFMIRDTTENVTVFVHNNLLYKLSGDIPTTEMKKIIDSFVVEE